MEKDRFYEDMPVGTRFVSRSVVVSAADIKRFAAEFDPQPFHTDEKSAAATFFKGLVGSGWHTCAITMRLIVESWPVAGGVVGAGVDELRWPNSMLPGDTLHAESEVIEARLLKSRPGMGVVRIRVTTRNQKGEAVQVMIPSVFAPTRAVAGPG